MLSIHNLAEKGNIGMWEIINAVALMIGLLFFLIRKLWIAGLM